MPSHTTRPRCAPCREAPPENRTVEAAVVELRADGFTAHVAPLVRAVDRHTARRMKCPACKRRGLGCKPFHKDASYRVLTVCPACGAAGDEI